MNESVALLFGIIVLITSFGLAGWEIFSHRRQDEEYRWLHTRSRLVRRITMAILLLFVAVLLLGEAMDVLVLDNLRHLLIYVSMLSALALALLVLSVRDLAETARNAERRALDDLKKAIEEQKDRGNPPGGV